MKNSSYTSHGKRYLVLHAGNKEGFIDGLGLILLCKNSKTDYHGNMNHVIFKEWFKKLLESLTEPSLIILDNAPYHSRVKEQLPST